jgi:hypothetical protein
MAFRMTRPTIQGTEYHKASVLKARAETVAQTRTAADPTLVAAGSELGRSYIPKAVDFTIKPAEIKIPEGDGKKKKGQSLDERLEKAEQGGQTEEQYYNDMMDQILKENPRKKEEKVQDEKYISPEPNQEDIDYAEELKRRSEELSAKRKLDNSTKLDTKTIKQLPTKVAKEKLLKGTGSVDNYIYQQGRFEKAAEEFGFNISQEKINHVKEVKGVDAEGNPVVKEVEAIRERNEAIIEAKKYHGITGDGKLTRPQLEEYQNMRVLQEQNEAKYQQNPIGIEEERSREWNEAPPGQETVSNRSDLQKGGKPMDVDNDGTPDFIQKPTQVEPSTQSTIQTTTKPKLSDFKDGKNAFGGFVSKKQAYDEATRKWRKQNPIQMRDDAIYKNAIKDGIVQKNMIKSGYKPLD